MKKRNLVYLASTAVLMVASAQQALADVQEAASNPQVNQANSEVTSKQILPKEEGQGEAWVSSDSSVSLSETATISEKSATQPVYEAQPSTQPTVDKISSSESQGDKQTVSSLVGDTSAVNGSTSFYNAASGAGDSSHVEPKGIFVDVSSHNGHISISDYQALARQGVSGVVVKLTQGTYYKNPYAQGQIQNAQAAGLKVSAYAFTEYTSEEEARSEARYFANHARELNLPASTVMVVDIENDPSNYKDVRSNVVAHTLAWTDEMRRLGYSDLVYYTAASWLDRNNIRTKGPIQTERFGLSNFWVAQYPSNNLSVEGAKSLNYNNGAAAWQFSSTAELLPGKHVFDLNLDYTGRFTKQTMPSTSVAPAAVKLTGTITITNQNNQTGSFDVVVTNVNNPGGVKLVSVPVWSSANGQDDLHWYNADRQSDGSYKVHVKASNHKNSTGEYNAHLYYVDNSGKLIGVGGTKTTVSIGQPAKPSQSQPAKPQPTETKRTGIITIQNNDSQHGTFDVVVTNVNNPGGVKLVSVPVWSSANGQDDLHWYNADRQSDGSYKVHVKASNHKNSTGEYNVHLYYVQNDGQMVGVGGTKTTVSKKIYNTPYFSQRDGRWAHRYYGNANMDSTGCVPTSLAMVISAIKEQTVLPTTVADYLYYQTNTFNKNLIGTDSNGIKYAAEHWGLTAEPLKTTASIKEALEDGHHVVIAVGNSKFVSYPITHDMVIYGYENGRTYLRDPYNAGNNGWYSINELFNIKSTDPMDLTLGSPFIAIKEKVQPKTSVAKPTGTISIQNNDSQQGTFDVVVTNVNNPGGVKLVSVPVWSSANGQDDLHWYNADRQSDGSYKVHVKASNHKNSTGEYNAHLYYVDNSGKLIGVGGTKTYL